MTDNKSLGLHQRIPLDILLQAIQAVLEDKLDEERLVELIATEYAGENRQRKGVHQIRTTIINNPILEYCKEHKVEVLSAIKSESDRNLILSAVIVARYPFCFDLFGILANQFRLQDEINTDLILRLLGAKYGANKSVYNVQINAVAQMLEAGLIQRKTVGVYTFPGALKANHKITYEIWKESYYINVPLANRDDSECIFFEPYFRYIDLL